MQVINLHAEVTYGIIMDNPKIRDLWGLPSWDSWCSCMFMCKAGQYVSAWFPNVWRFERGFNMTFDYFDG